MYDFNDHMDSVVMETAQAVIKDIDLKTVHA